MRLKRKLGRRTTDSVDLYLYREGFPDDEEFMDFSGDLSDLRSPMNEPVRTICYHVSPSRSSIGVRFRLTRHYWGISGLGLNGSQTYI